ncbi:MAG: hypothetical protein NZ518_06570 [Dehalococcoidia bacterium]|nr:hypothetical protein [Dehalococcoidia bacterium]
MPFPPIDEMKKIALEFCRPPRISQMYTVDRNGLITGRSLGAPLNDDFTVDIVTIRDLGFKRADQVRRNPAVSFTWVEPRPNEPGKVAKVIFGKGKGVVQEGEPVAQWFNKNAAGGRFGNMTVDEAVQRWVIIHVTIESMRAEGFTIEGTELTREEIRYGLTFKP